MFRHKPIIWLHQPRAREEPLSIRLKSEFFKDAVRLGILRMMPRQKFPRAERRERVVNNRPGGLFGQSPAPKSRQQLESHNENLLREIVRTHPAAARELVAIEKENRPILKRVGLLASDFAS